jgi:hypothetical protein
MTEDGTRVFVAQVNGAANSNDVRGRAIAGAGENIWP